MFSKGFKIVDKKRFDLYIEEVSPQEDEAIVKIETAALCKADLRYYLGDRDARTLGLKYPMNLIHEAVGVVVKDPTGRFQSGQRVTLCPNIVSEEDRQKYKVCRMEGLGENYCPTASFASSNYNGFSRSYLSFKADNLIPLPEGLPNSVLVFSELISVAISALRRIPILANDVIGIWGDGVVGYILQAVLSVIHKGRVIVVGKHDDKLRKFEGAVTYKYTDEKLRNEQIDIAVECIGGRAAESGIDQIIDVIQPGGRVILTGVTESKVAINTRKILEKGISMYGVTRSNVEDFKKATALFYHRDFCRKIESLVLDELTILDINDYYAVFEKEADNRDLGKYVMHFMF